MIDPNKVPVRYRAPAWMHEYGLPRDLEAAEDLIAICFWAQIDQRTRAATLATMRRIPEWNIDLESEEQKPQLREIYHQVWAQNEAENIVLLVDNLDNRKKLLAIAKDMAADKIDDIRTVAERIEIRLILDIKESGDLGRLDGEYDNITEYLLSKRSPEDEETGQHAGNYSETAFIIDVLIPSLESMGISRETLIGVATNFGKAKIAIPYLRQLLKGGHNLTETEMEKLMYVINSIQTSSKKGGPTYAEFRKRVDGLMRGKTLEDKEEPMSIGYVYNTTRGGVLQIQVNDPHRLRTLISLTESIVDWHEGDTLDLAKQAQAAILNQDLPEDELTK